MKYLYIRLTDTDIITFKSMVVEKFANLYKITFNGTQGTFVIVDTKDECVKIADKIEEYLTSDDAEKRLLNLMKYNMWNYGYDGEEE